MRLFTGGVSHIASTIEDDLTQRDTKLGKPHISGLADLSACVLTCRNANTGDWLSVLPRKVGDEKSKERYISRVLSNRFIDPFDVMNGFIPEIIEMVSKKDQTIILMIDQSKISTGFECLMVSLRLAERAIPVAWKVIETKGAIGFDVQKELLEKVKDMLPSSCSVLLAGDRFYGTSTLISWCQKNQ